MSTVLLVRQGARRRELLKVARERLGLLAGLALLERI